jgi:two-component system sensor histidine kinase RegB
VLIVLRWLCRLRWLAVMGQTLAITLGFLILHLPLPMSLLGAWVGAAMGSNLILSLYLLSSQSPPRVLVPLILLLDVILLTGMLASTGGAANPFCVFYLIHVAMAVVVARTNWSWAVLVTTLICYAAMFFVDDHIITNSDLPAWIWRAGSWTALALTAVVLTYFVGQLRSTLRIREKQITSMADRVNRSDRLAALTALAAGAAHELGSPLGTIMLAASEMQHHIQQGKTPADLPHLREDLDLIAQQAQRCRRILDSMNADTVRHADEDPTQFTSMQLLDDLKAELLASQWDQLHIQDRMGQTPITTRKHTLIQALGILIHNALDASADTNTPITLTIQQADSSCQCVIQDRGSGISDQQLQHLGEPFRTTKNPQQGMGLGLFLARLMTEQLHGRLTIHSAPGKGTIAVLQFKNH